MSSYGTFTPEDLERIERYNNGEGADLIFDGTENEGVLGDIGTGLKRSALNMARLGVGLADIATGGAATEVAGSTLDDWDQSTAKEYSPERQIAALNRSRAVDAAPTQFGKAMAMIGSTLSNPSLLASEVAETAFPTGGPIIAARAIGSWAGRKAAERAVRASGQNVVAKAIAKKTPQEIGDEVRSKVSSAAARIGEGVVAGGMTAQQIVSDNIREGRDKTDGLWSALAVGGTTALTSTVMGKVFPSANYEAILAGGRQAIAKAATKELIAKKSAPQSLLGRSWQAGKDLGKSFLTEGTEEAIQGAFETGLPNYARGKPIEEGMGENVGQSFALGGAMGAGMHGISMPFRPSQEELIQRAQGKLPYHQGNKTVDTRDPLTEAERAKLGVDAENMPIQGKEVTPPAGNEEASAPTFAEAYAGYKERHADRQDKIWALESEAAHAQNDLQRNMLLAEADRLRREDEEDPGNPKNAPKEMFKPVGEATGSDQAVATGNEDAVLANYRKRAEVETAPDTSVDDAKAAFPRSTARDRFSGSKRGTSISKQNAAEYAAINHPEKKAVSSAMDEANDHGRVAGDKRPFSSGNRLIESTMNVLGQTGEGTSAHETLDKMADEQILSKDRNTIHQARAYKFASLRLQNPDADPETISMGVNAWEKAKRTEHAKKEKERRAKEAAERGESVEEPTEEPSETPAPPKKGKGKKAPKAEATPPKKTKAQLDKETQEEAGKYFPRSIVVPKDRESRGRSIRVEAAKRFLNYKNKEKQKVAAAVDEASESIQNAHGNRIYHSSDELVDLAIEVMETGKTVENGKPIGTAEALHRKAKKFAESNNQTENNRAPVIELAALRLENPKADISDLQAQVSTWAVEAHKARKAKRSAQGQTSSGQTPPKQTFANTPSGQFAKDCKLSSDPGKTKYALWQYYEKRLGKETSDALFKSTMIAMSQDSAYTEDQSKNFDAVYPIAASVADAYLESRKGSTNAPTFDDLSRFVELWEGESLLNFMEKFHFGDANVVKDLSYAISNKGEEYTAKDKADEDHTASDNANIDEKNSEEIADPNKNRGQVYKVNPPVRTWLDHVPEDEKGTRTKFSRREKALIQKVKEGELTEGEVAELISDPKDNEVYVKPTVSGRLFEYNVTEKWLNELNAMPDKPAPTGQRTPMGNLTMEDEKGKYGLTREERMALRLKLMKFLRVADLDEFRATLGYNWDPERNAPEEANFEESARQYEIRDALGRDDSNDEEWNARITNIPAQTLNRRRQAYIQRKFYAYIAKTLNILGPDARRLFTSKKDWRIGIDGQTVQTNKSVPAKEDVYTLEPHFIQAIKDLGKYDDFCKFFARHYPEILNDLAIQILRPALRCTRRDAWQKNVVELVGDVMYTTADMIEMSDLLIQNTQFTVFFNDLFGAASINHRTLKAAKESLINLLAPLQELSKCETYLHGGRKVRGKEAHRRKITEGQLAHMFSVSERAFYLSEQTKEAQRRITAELGESNEEFFSKKDVEGAIDPHEQDRFRAFARKFTAKEFTNTGKRRSVQGEYDRVSGEFKSNVFANSFFNQLIQSAVRRNWFKQIKFSTGNLIIDMDGETPSHYEQVIPSPLDRISGMREFFNKFATVKDLTALPEYRDIIQNKGAWEKIQKTDALLQDIRAAKARAKSAKAKAQHEVREKELLNSIQDNEQAASFLVELMQVQTAVRVDMGASFSRDNGNIFLGLYREGVRKIYLSTMNYAGTRESMIRQFERPIRKALDAADFSQNPEVKDRILAGMKEINEFAIGKINREEQLWPRVGETRLHPLADSRLNEVAPKEGSLSKEEKAELPQLDDNYNVIKPEKKRGGKILGPNRVKAATPEQLEAIKVFAEWQKGVRAARSFLETYFPKSTERYLTPSMEGYEYNVDETGARNQKVLNYLQGDGHVSPEQMVALKKLKTPLKRVVIAAFDEAVDALTPKNGYWMGAPYPTVENLTQDIIDLLKKSKKPAGLFKEINKSIDSLAKSDSPLRVGRVAALHFVTVRLSHPLAPTKELAYQAREVAKELTAPKEETEAQQQEDVDAYKKANKPYEKVTDASLDAMETSSADPEIIESAVFARGGNGGVMIPADVAMRVLIKSNFDPSCLEGVVSRSAAISIAKMCQFAHTHGYTMTKGLWISDGSLTSVKTDKGSRFTPNNGALVKGVKVKKNAYGKRETTSVNAPGGIITLRVCHPSVMSTAERAQLDANKDTARVEKFIETRGIHEFIHAKIAENSEFRKTLTKHLTSKVVSDLETLAEKGGMYSEVARHSLRTMKNARERALHNGATKAQAEQLAKEAAAEELLAGLFPYYMDKGTPFELDRAIPDEQLYSLEALAEEYESVESSPISAEEAYEASKREKEKEDSSQAGSKKPLAEFYKNLDTWLDTVDKKRVLEFLATIDISSSHLERTLTNSGLTGIIDFLTGVANDGLHESVLIRSGKVSGRSGTTQAETGGLAEGTRFSEGLNVRDGAMANSNESGGRESEGTRENLLSGTQRGLDEGGVSSISGDGAGTLSAVHASGKESSEVRSNRREASTDGAENDTGRGHLQRGAGEQALSTEGNRETAGEQAARGRLEVTARDRIVDALPQGLRPVAQAILGTSKNGALRFMFARNLVKEFKHLLPSIEKWWRSVEKLMQERSVWQQKASDIAEHFSKLSKDEQGRLSALAIESTTSNFWAYRDDRVFPTQKAWDDYMMHTAAIDEEGYALFLKRYNALSKEAKQIFRDIFNLGTEEKLELFRIKKREAERFGRPTDRMSKDLYDALEHPYLSLGRHGKHVVTYRSVEYMNLEKAIAKLQKEISEQGTKATKAQEKALKTMKADLDKLVNQGDKHYVVEFYESPIEANKRYDQLRRDFPDAPNEGIQIFEKALYMGNQVPGWAASSELLRELKKDMDAENGTGTIKEKDLEIMTDVLTDLYIRKLPDAAAQKAMLRRRGVAGYSENIMENFLRHAQATSHLIASMDNSSAIHEALEAMNEEVRAQGATGQRNEASIVANEVRRRQMQIFSPTKGGAPGAIMRTTSMWMLLTNPAFYLQNLLQPAMMSAPYIDGRLRISCLGELVGVMKQIGGLISKDKTLRNLKDRLPRDEYEALMSARDHQLLTIGLASELGEVSDTSPLGKTTNWFSKKAQTVETINRVSTFLVAYRNAKKKKMSEKEAREFAEEVIVQTHGDYSKENAPSIMNENQFLRMATQFRKFQFIQAGMVYRLLRDSAKSELSPAERAIARRQLALIMMTHFAMAGLKGTPLVAQAMALSSLVMGMGGSGDDDEDLIRRTVKDKDMSDLLLKGIPMLFGVDLSKKVGAGDMHSILPFYEFDVAKGKRNASELALNAAGPWASVGAKFWEGASYLLEGNYGKAMENILPYGLFSNSLKAYRLADEGYTNRAGDVLIKPEGMSGFDHILTALGLTSKTMSRRNYLQGWTVRHDNEFSTEKTRIQRELNEAKANRDYKGVAAAYKRLGELNRNRKNAGYTPIPAKQLDATYKQRLKREREAVGGVVSTKQNRAGLQRQSQW